MGTGLGLYAACRAQPAAVGPKPVGGVPPLGARVREFDTWRPGYGNNAVEVLQAGTTTLAPLYSDPFLTTPVPNPQTLIAFTDPDGNVYGKWAQPVYTFVSYTLFIDQTNQTGVEVPPLTTLDGIDISVATAVSLRGDYERRITDFMDRDVDATLFGSLSEADGSATCTQTLALAVGAAAAQGGGAVLLPPLNIPITGLTLPEGVILEGNGTGVTTLRSTQTGTPVITLGGDGSGLRSLSLDGIDVVPQSVGVYMVGINFPVMEEVLIQRFETGMRARGGSGARWRNFQVSNCTNGLNLRGDQDAAASTNGAELADLRWDGGEVSLCTGYGLFLEFFDLGVRDIHLSNVLFAGNTSDALRLQGARGVTCTDCQWSTNTAALSVLDGTNLTFVALNTVERVRFFRGTINGGSLTFNQTCLDLQFNGVSFINVSFNATVPVNPVTIIDCLEDAQTTETGDTTKLLRITTQSVGTVQGITTDGNPLVAWEKVMQPGQVALVSARAIARRRDGITYGVFWGMAGVACPGATMPYQSATTAFTVGLVLIGATSGASARIVALTGTTTGNLTLRDIVGTFVPGEIVNDSASGTGRFVGSLTLPGAALDGTGYGVIRANTTTGSGWVIAIAVESTLVQVTVQGEGGATVEWTVEITVTEP